MSTQICKQHSHNCRCFYSSEYLQNAHSICKLGSALYSGETSDHTLPMLDHILKS